MLVFFPGWSLQGWSLLSFSHWPLAARRFCSPATSPTIQKWSSCQAPCFEWWSIATWLRNTTGICPWGRCTNNVLFGPWFMKETTDRMIINHHWSAEKKGAYALFPFRPIHRQQPPWTGRNDRRRGRFLRPVPLDVIKRPLGHIHEWRI